MSEAWCCCSYNQLYPPRTHQVTSLVVKAARGCARLMLRGGFGGCTGQGGLLQRSSGLIQAHPDCTVAILLCETTLRNRLVQAEGSTPFTPAVSDNKKNVTTIYEDDYVGTI